MPEGQSNVSFFLFSVMNDPQLYDDRNVDGYGPNKLLVKEIKLQPGETSFEAKIEG